MRRVNATFLGDLSAWNEISLRGKSWSDCISSIPTSLLTLLISSKYLLATRCSNRGVTVKERCSRDYFHKDWKKDRSILSLPLPFTFISLPETFTLDHSALVRSSNLPFTDFGPSTFGRSWCSGGLFGLTLNATLLLLRLSTTVSPSRRRIPPGRIIQQIRKKIFYERWSQKASIRDTLHFFAFLRPPPSKSQAMALLRKATSFLSRLISSRRMIYERFPSTGSGCWPWGNHSETWSCFTSRFGGWKYTHYQSYSENRISGD